MCLASNGRSLVQPSGEIKFRAINHTTIKTKCSSSNLKRKRMISSSSPPPTPLSCSSLPMAQTKSHSTQPVKNSTAQIDVLRRRLLSCRPEEFRGPALPFDDPNYNRDSHVQKHSSTWQNYCFVCRKSSVNHGPSIHCDHCPLTYHLDCLTPPMTSLPSSADKWMCPNHIEPILDRYLLDKNRFSTSERVKIYRKYSNVDHQTLLQEFSRMRQTRKHLLWKTDQHRLERIEISHIPNVIEQYYHDIHRSVTSTCDNTTDENIDNQDVNTVQVDCT
jgi:hypothetical protein